MFNWEEDYFEPSEFDQKIEEFKDELRTSVRQEIKDEVEKLRRENKKLQGIKKNFDVIKNDFEKKKAECERVMHEAEYNAKCARLSELMEPFKTIMWSITWEYRYKKKCDKCSVSRDVPVILPSGRTVSDDCKCSVKQMVYYPRKNALYEFNYFTDDFRVFYKEIGDKGSRCFVADANSHDADVIINHDKSFDEIEKAVMDNMYTTFFTSAEECREFCDYLNKKNNTDGYDYDLYGELINRK